MIPGSTIGVFGAGQLGRMLALAAAPLGFRMVTLDPDPAAAATAVSARTIVARYDDLPAAVELARASDVVTYELEHIDVRAAEAAAAIVALRPGVRALRMTQDRLSERGFLAELGVTTAPWAAVAEGTDRERAAGAADGLALTGLPARLKRAIGGYDGRGQWLVTDGASLRVALREAAGAPLLVERELDFVAELSVVCTRAADGSTAAFPVAQNTHDGGILVTSVAPAPFEPAALSAAAELGTRIAVALDVVGTLTTELFLLRDGSLVVNELAPRVHNSGHYTLDACVTSQFEQHVRAIVGLPLGSSAMHGHAAMVNLLGTGPRRQARLLGTQAALADDGVRLHVYGKQEVFERRKMGHVTVVAASADDALDRARRAAACLRWAA